MTNISDSPRQPQNPAQGSPWQPPGEPPDSALTPGRTIPSAPALAIAVVLSLIVGGVGGYLIGAGGSGSDVSESGQISYACAVAEKTLDDQGDFEDWLLGEDSAFSELMGVSGLLGGMEPTAGTIGEFHDLGRRISSALATLDEDELVSALEATVTECKNR